MSVSYSLGQLLDDTLRQLRGTTRDLVNALSEPLDAPAPLTQEIIYLSNNVNGVTVGSLLTVADETMYVIDISTTAISATVFRGFDGTMPVTAAAGSLVNIDPPWTRAVIRDRVRDEIRSWAPQVWAPAAVDIPIVNQQRGYDLGAITKTIIRILRVTAPAPPYVGSPGYWVVPGNTNTSLADPTFPFLYNSNANTSEFPSGKSITLTGPTLPNIIANLHVVYATPFDVDTSWTDATDMIAQVGMDSRDLDIPGMGAAARLLRGISVRRAMLNVEGQSREDQDVTMQAILQAAGQFKLDTVSRLGDVRERLYSDWPIRQSNY